MRTRTALASSLALLSVLTAPALADTITKTNGETLSGLVVAETNDVVTLQTNFGGIVLQQKIAKKDISSIHKDAIAQNRYCLIPIHGEIGPDVKAKWIAKALDQAAAFNANYIVFDIDSPGGEVYEMKDILEVLSKQSRFQTIAYVRRAMSAAAIIALSCRTIVVEPRAGIGAAVPWQIGPKGTPEDVEAKFLSAFRALAKSTAEFGHHSPLLAQGMMDMNLVLSITHEKTPEIVEGDADDSTPLKKKGEILCLSATDAIRCGLAADTVTSINDLQRTLSLKDWSPVGQSVWSFMESRPAADKADQEKQTQTLVAASQKQQLEKALEALDARIKVVSQAKEDAENRLSSIPKDCQAELDKSTTNLTLEQREAKRIEINGRYEALFHEAQNTFGRADMELQDLNRVRTNILAKLNDK